MEPLPGRTPPAPARRSERGGKRLRQQLANSGSRIEQIRHLTVAVLAVGGMLVGLMLWGGRSLSIDPTRRALDEVSPPAWAAHDPGDDTYGSRWCLDECRVRVRTWNSEGKVEETGVEYWEALMRDRWVPVERTRCPGGDAVDGCFTRDELFLELWVVPKSCEDRFELCTGSEVTAIVASQAAWPRLAEEAEEASGGPGG
ncbi:hypothetical protein [Salininema proteolyticum]|uniref:Uncharacterized protein n=1 Tax=Salininema proteolyticum TaxID=1607685 RepID=A0ABV8TXQ6_9ACTN